jgi:hypothetical protein
MQAPRRNPRRNQGAALVLVAVAMITVAAVAALAVDLGMLYKAKGDAQRAAEAAALAGASAFTEFAANDPEIDDTAQDRTYRYGQSNKILIDTLKSFEILNPTNPLDTTLRAPQVVRDSQLVRVLVRRQEVGTWFARLLGVSAVPVSAIAAAKAEAAGGGGCVKPIAIPDMWSESSQDANGDRLEEDGEDWTYDPGADTYNPGNPDTPTIGTGYGSGLRDGTGPYVNDFGRPISLRLPDPAAPTPATGPRQFVPFTPVNGQESDVNQYIAHIETCDADVELGTRYNVMDNTQPIPAATKQGVDSLIQADPSATWDDNTKTIRDFDPRYGNWRNSPRVIKVGFFDPSQLPSATSTTPMTSVTLNNLGLMFIESWDDATNTLNGRFFYFASGAGDLTTANTGTLVKRLRLVQ